MGLLAAVTERLTAAIHSLHRVEEPRPRSVQDRRSSGPSQALGHTEEPPEHELRQDVTSATVLLQSQHPAQGPGRETLLPVSIHYYTYVM